MKPEEAKRILEDQPFKEANEIMRKHNERLDREANVIMIMCILLFIFAVLIVIAFIAYLIVRCEGYLK